MIGPECDDECPQSHPIAAAVIAGVFSLLGAAIGPWLAYRLEREKEERERADRLARLEGLLMSQAEEDDDE